MRIEHRYLTSAVNDKVIRKAIKVLQKNGVVYDYKEDINCVIPTFRFNLEFSLYEDEDNFEALTKVFSKIKLTPHQVGTIFEKEDIKNAEWFWISTGNHQYPQPEKDFGYRSETFNLENYCSTCGIGKIQNAPFRLRTSPKQHRSEFWGLHWEFEAKFVRPFAKEIIEAENIDGISFDSVKIHKNGETIKDFYQLDVASELPSGLITTNCQQVTCKFMNEEDVRLSEKWRNQKEANFCGRVKYNFPIRGGLTFNKMIFQGQPEIVKTYEWFGSGASARKLILVSKRIKELFEAKKLRGIFYAPILH